MNVLLKIGLSVCALSVAPLPHADELGRLFFTPHQRAMLDRGQNAAIGEPANIDSLTINGIVQRHGGERTIWINGVPTPAGKSDEHSPGTASVAIPGQSRKIRAKVGQKVPVNPAAGKQ